MKVIGLTGGSGSGKTTVAVLLSQLTSVCIIDADKIGHEILKKGKPAYDAVLERFGEAILKADGEIDRKKLGQIVFANQSLLEILNKITHPLIIQEIIERIHQIKSSDKACKYIIVDAALLIESGLHKAVDEIWLVYAPEEIRLKRIAQRDGMTTEEARRRIASQMPWEEMKKYGDVIIDNGHNEAYTMKQLNHIISSG